MNRRQYVVGAAALLSGCTGRLTDSPEDQPWCPDGDDETVICYSDRTANEYVTYLGPVTEEAPKISDGFRIALVNESEHALNTNVHELAVYGRFDGEWQQLHDGNRWVSQTTVQPNQLHVWDVRFDEGEETGADSESVTIGDPSGSAYSFRIDGDWRDEEYRFACAVDVP